MLKNYTLCDKIKKIQPGCYITYKDGIIKEKQYFRLDNKPNSLSYQENIERLEDLFCKAVDKEYAKDKEYGYEHICALSGGLDCRMTSFVAHELGYKKQLNVTFSQSDYWDEIIPKQIARDLHHEWLFKSLDNGMFLFDADYITKRTGGNVLYYATAFSDSLCRYINWSNLGMFHSGQLGDVVIGSKCKCVDERFVLGDGAYSLTLINNVNYSPDEKVANKEIGLYYYRYLNGTNNGIQDVYNYTEFSSPFCELDFLTFCLSIPLEYRYKHKIYKDWICAKHPDAANYVWQTTGAFINEPILNILGRKIPKSQVKKKFKRKVRKILGRNVEDERRDGMNPLQKYLDENTELKLFYDSYKIYLDKIQNKKLKQHVSYLMDSGNAYEKNMALTLLAAIKAYF